MQWLSHWFGDLAWGLVYTIQLSRIKKKMVHSESIFPKTENFRSIFLKMTSLTIFMLPLLFEWKWIGRNYTLGRECGFWFWMTSFLLTVAGVWWITIVVNREEQWQFRRRWSDKSWQESRLVAWFDVVHNNS